MSNLNINHPINVVDNQTFDFVEMPVDNIQAFQTTRICPRKNVTVNSNVTYSPYEYFNLGAHVNDNDDLVNANREHLLTYLPSSTQIQWLNQVHGNQVEVITRYSKKPMTADAAITTSANIALAIMTADCLPILLSNTQGTEIAAIHGGWRPLVGNIISHTLNKMKSKNEDVVAWLGPCISQVNFEVGNEVKQHFELLSSEYQQAFQKGSNNKSFANLQLIATMMLVKEGVKVINKNDSCTFQNNKRYYSYRKEKITGRMASIIGIKS
jgi:YfiH family protein